MNTESSYIYDERKHCYVKAATATYIVKKENVTLLHMKRIGLTGALMVLMAGALLRVLPFVVGMLGGAEVNAATTGQSEVVTAGR